MSAVPDFQTINRLSESELQTAIDLVRRLARDKVEIDVLTKHLEPIFRGYAAKCPIFDPGLHIYRAVAWPERPKRREDISYAPVEKVTRYGRTHRPAQSIFYGSFGREAPFFEIDCKPGMTVAVSRWRTTDRLIVNRVGYTDDIFTKLASARKADFNLLTAAPPNISEAFPKTNDLIQAFLAEEFCQHIPDDSHENYRLSVAIAEKLLGRIIGFDGDKENVFGGIMYPAMKMRANADNLALLPTFVDTSMTLEQVEFFRVDNTENFSYKITSLDFANSWSANGLLEWHGRGPQWTLPSGEGLTLQVENGVWVARDTNGNVVPFDGAPKAALPQVPYLNEFTNDFPTSLVVGEETSLKDQAGTETKIFSKLGFDLSTNTTFLAFLLPPSNQGAAVMSYVLKTNHEFIERLSNVAQGIQTDTNQKDWWKGFTFSGKVLFYCNANIEQDLLETMTERYKSQGLNFEWRGLEYLVPKYGLRKAN